MMTASLKCWLHSNRSGVCTISSSKDRKYTRPHDKRRTTAYK